MGSGYKTHPFPKRKVRNRRRRNGTGRDLRRTGKTRRRYVTRGALSHRRRKPGVDKPSRCVGDDVFTEVGPWSEEREREREVGRKGGRGVDQGKGRGDPGGSKTGCEECR